MSMKLAQGGVKIKAAGTLHRNVKKQNTQSCHKYSARKQIERYEEEYGEDWESNSEEEIDFSEDFSDTNKHKSCYENKWEDPDYVYTQDYEKEVQKFLESNGFDENGGEKESLIGRIVKTDEDRRAEHLSELKSVFFNAVKRVYEAPRFLAGDASFFNDEEKPWNDDRWDVLKYNPSPFSFKNLHLSEDEQAQYFERKAEMEKMGFSFIYDIYGWETFYKNQFVRAGSSTMHTDNWNPNDVPAHKIYKSSNLANAIFAAERFMRRKRMRFSC